MNTEFPSIHPKLESVRGTLHVQNQQLFHLKDTRDSVYSLDNDGWHVVVHVVALQYYLWGSAGNPDWVRLVYVHLGCKFAGF